MGVPSIILAGGKSTRMGQDKALLLWKNKTWIENVVQVLEAADCTPIIISVNSKSNIGKLQEVVKNEGVIWVYDDERFSGMKGGLISSLKVAVEREWEIVQLAPCDIPMIKTELFHLFDRISSNEDYDIIVPEIIDKCTKSNGLEPLLARIKVVSYLNKLTDLNNKDQRIIGAYSGLNIHVVKKEVWMKEGITPDCLKNCNTPNDIKS